MARLNIAKSQVRPSISSLVRIDQSCLAKSGGFAPINFPLFQAVRFGEIEFSVSMAILIGWEEAMMRRSAWRTGFTVAWARHGSGRIPSDFTRRLLNGRIGVLRQLLVG